KELARFPASAAVYLPDGVPPQPERYLPLGKLADTLKTVAAHGPEGFYRGAVAESMAADLAAGGSRITAEDLAAYAPLFTEPLRGTHRGADLYTPNETSGGLRLNEAFAYVAEHLDTGQPIGAHTYATYAKALNLAFENHERRIGRLTAQSSTSHMSAADADGNMVALTYTLLSRFGSRVVLPGTGVLMNNSVSYFDPRPGYPTSMEGGKRINASNMCPTVCVRDGAALFAVGASGANHIVPATMQVAAFMLDYGIDLEDAFNRPRIDAGGRASIRVDPALGADVLTGLGREFELEVAQNVVFPKLYACPSGVSRDPASGRTWACADRANPVAGAAAAAPFTLDVDVGETAEVRA
ncbi:MAG: gamma-glutamyltransferase, partial [Rhodospirillaceae bacterium]